MEDLPIEGREVKASSVRTLSSVYTGYTYFANGDVLLAKITPCFENGKVGIVSQLRNGVGFGSSEYFVLRPRAGVSREWLYYFLSRQSFRDEGAARMSGAVGHKRVTKEFLRSYSMPLPTLAEQARIVGILDEAFSGLATAKSKSEANRQAASELFESYLSNAFEVGGNDWVDFGLPLSDMCELIVDCEHKTAPKAETGIPLIRTPNIGRGFLNLEHTQLVSEETYREWSRRAEPRPGDLILAREAPAGNVGVIPKGQRVCLGQRTVLIRPSARFVESDFLAWALLQPRVRRTLLAHSRGATVEHVNMRDIRALQLGAIPPLDQQRRFVHDLATVRNECTRLEATHRRKIKALDELKQSLLHRAFTGQL